MKIAALLFCITNIAACGADERPTSAKVDETSDEGETETPAAEPAPKSKPVPVFAPVDYDDASGDPTPPQFVDMRLAPIVAEFLAEAADRGVPTPDMAQVQVIKFVSELENFTNKTGDTLAFCIPRIGRNDMGILKTWREIHVLDPKRTSLSVDSDYQPDPTNLNLKRVLFHELGHCVLNKDHHRGKITSIMAARYVPLFESANVWPELVEEFFSAEYQAELAPIERNRR